jgi:hypothetical protein
MSEKIKVLVDERRDLSKILEVCAKCCIIENKLVVLSVTPGDPKIEGEAIHPRCITKQIELAANGQFFRNFYVYDIKSLDFIPAA